MIRMTMRRLTKGRWPKIRAGEELSCPEVGLLMQRFLDGEMDEEIEVQALADHLGKCVPCGHEADVFRNIKDALERGRPALDDDTVARLREFGQRLAEG